MRRGRRARTDAPACSARQEGRGQSCQSSGLSLCAPFASNLLAWVVMPPLVARFSPAAQVQGPHAKPSPTHFMACLFPLTPSSLQAWDLTPPLVARSSPPVRWPPHQAFPHSFQGLPVPPDSTLLAGMGFDAAAGGKIQPASALAPVDVDAPRGVWAVSPTHAGASGRWQ